MSTISRGLIQHHNAVFAGATKSNSISGGGGNGGLAIDPDFQKTEKGRFP